MVRMFSESDLRNISGIIADTSSGLTKSELKRYLEECRIEVLSDGSSKNQWGYVIGLNKREWLYNCFSNEVKKIIQ